VMNTSAVLRSAASYALLSLLLASTQVAAAGAQRTFDAANGNDSNTAFNCSKVNPCRTLAAALSVTAPGGQVYLLDPVGYGVATITQSVEIDGLPLAGITASSGTALTINAPGANVVVNNVTLTGIGATVGIDDIDSASLTLRNINVSGFAIGVRKESAGTLFIDPSTFYYNSEGGLILTSTGGPTHIKDSHFFRNGGGGAGQGGMLFDGPVTATVEHVNLSQNFPEGLTITNSTINPANVDLVDVVATQNTGNGVAIFPGAGAPVNFSATRSIFSGEQGSGLFVNTVPLGSRVVVSAADSDFNDNKVNGVQFLGAGFTGTFDTSRIGGNLADGVSVNNGLGVTGGVLILNSSTIANNGGAGLHCSCPGGTITLTGVHFTNNTGAGVSAAGGQTTYSGLDDILNLNLGGNVLPTPVLPIPKQ
jgi:hypothetical protein